MELTNKLPDNISHQAWLSAFPAVLVAISAYAESLGIESPGVAEAYTGAVAALALHATAMGANLPSQGVSDQEHRAAAAFIDTCIGQINKELSGGLR
jgi:hypothetical protein